MTPEEKLIEAIYPERMLTVIHIPAFNPVSGPFHYLA